MPCGCLLTPTQELPFTYLLFFHVEPEAARIAHRLNFRTFNAVYVLILAPSALWMPLTFEMLNHPTQRVWLAIRLTLGIVGLASVALVGALLNLRPRRPVRIYWLSVAGSVVFAIHTALLDAIVWPIYFPL